MIDFLGDILSSIVDGFVSVVETILSIPATMIELLGDLLKSLFVPSEDYFDDKVETIKSRFDFIDSLTDTVHVFTNFFENNSFLEPPTITVNLSSSESKINYGMNAKAIDFSWYAPFKPTVDVLLSGIMWSVFTINVFRAAPGIINGGSSALSSTAELKGDKKE